MTKCCGKCREVKPHSEFWKDASRKSGLSNWCILCMKMFKDKHVHNISEAALRTMRIKMCQEKLKFWQDELDKALNTKVEIISKSVRISKALERYHAKRKEKLQEKIEPVVEKKSVELVAGLVK